MRIRMMKYWVLYQNPCSIPCLISIENNTSTTRTSTTMTVMTLMHIPKYRNNINIWGETTIRSSWDISWMRINLEEAKHARSYSKHALEERRADDNVFKPYVPIPRVNHQGRFDQTIDVAPWTHLEMFVIPKSCSTKIVSLNMHWTLLCFLTNTGNVLSKIYTLVHFIPSCRWVPRSVDRILESKTKTPRGSSSRSI